ncbi:HlyD family efflux transporter periplasmic adaptor subunit [Ulvibacterium sp.]|uniref:efflux RND transporter periplasmic adaptor subunit n=1 Tax=Ulvibacterium sp. TaxID=2665914 RepID=UPI002607DAB4|nr:HlyD family efflux transporter periplasmic adaptor subunit [Ulvibacterium sp.]
MRKLNIIKMRLMLAGIGLMGIACGSTAEKESSEPQEGEPANNSQSTVQVIRKSDLKLQTVKNENVTTYLPITGRVIPKNSTQLVAEVQGRILLGVKSFKEGTSFGKGQTLLRIDSQEFALTLESQKNTFLNILTGMMPDLKADYPDNYQNWLNYVSNYKTGGALPELPQTTSDSEKYFVTSRQVYNTYYSIKAQEERLSKFTLKAPYSGSLSSTLVDNGGLVSPGQPLGTFISNQVYEIESAVSLKLANALKVGQKIEFNSKELNKIFTAMVVRINDIVDPNTQNIPVFLSVKDKALRSGMYLEGRVPSKTYENAMSIPIDILERDNTVHILQNGVIKKQEVFIMNTGMDQVTVRGLVDNSQLVLTTFENPISGLKITK